MVTSTQHSELRTQNWQPANGTPEWLYEELKQLLPAGRILHRPIDLIAFASDASFYRLIPQAIVFPRTIKEVAALFRYSQRRRFPITFRSAGTSLSGQAVTDGILVETKRYWQGLTIEADGLKVRVQPGVIGAQANLMLLPYRTKIGPDPASIQACTLGGILSNNSSGMCCGVAQNAYHTLDSLTFVLPSGTTIDTADPEADLQFQEQEPKLATGLLELRQRILANEALTQRIRAKYRMKNTTGYALNALIDFERPIDIFSHLLIGSEGTLAFIAEAVLNTVPVLPHKYTGLLIFPDLYAACGAIVPFRDAGAKALELMDRASLRSVEDKPGMPPYLKTLPPDAAGLLVEFQEAETAAIPAMKAAAESTVAALELLVPAEFTEDKLRQKQLWDIRGGMYPSIGAIRQSGTSAIIEDVAFPIDHLADAAVDLTKLFQKHGYDNAILYGHAKDGNLHFVITQSFNDQAAIDQYARLIDDVVELVVKKYEGALKAEHGTGRNMAPFVEAEWGGEALDIMRQLKALADPDHLLNPGVIVNADPQAHLKDLKSTPTIEAIADKCIECGYCEHVCPSRDLTLTPRQRIVVRREMIRQQQLHSGNSPLLRELQRDYPYLGMDTCAGDGMCATACPVTINTGELMRQFQHRKNPSLAEAIAHQVACHFAPIESATRLGLRVGHLVQDRLGSGVMVGVTGLIRKVIGPQFPQWSPEIPRPADPLPITNPSTAQAIYLSSCMTRMCGHIPGEPSDRSLQAALVAIADRAHFPLHIPPNVHGTCCGLAFEAKGFEAAQTTSANQTVHQCWEWTHQGQFPIVMDASACSQFLRHARPLLTTENQRKFDQLTIFDSVDFIHDKLLANLQINRKIPSVVIHPMCSLFEMGLQPKLDAIAKAFADETVIPAGAGCCGFAGDRGFFFPELTAAATYHEAQDLAGQNYAAYVSSNRMCEVGMTRATGKIYRSYIHLLEEATR
ncbi:FAD-binding oxidoreductase [Kovacikia minuta CCNUW1]|uniref:FAD-binding and (Fe-S)-binding domain-containing protein n=1 Tax=Kovacikia minuta TaxID=2931930 RepID=UPI001CCF05C9|nr:FAD-binding and (Fe-S)-binding domain-containing protein [Kovacikia minuta]UBF29327.1 FAD-binding oxidoreductase [Kovacikia minuta CCNUW1]